MLGAVQPREGVNLYGDALRTLSQRLSYLYGSDSRYWFEVRPNLNKVAADRSLASRPTRRCLRFEHACGADASSGIAVNSPQFTPRPRVPPT